jgi:hypothetical protein
MGTRSRIPGIRRLVAIVLGIALMFAPMGTHLGMISATVPQAQQVIAAGHCNMQTKRPEHGKTLTKTCRLSAGFAVAISPQLWLREKPARPGLPVFAPTIFSAGFLSEIATPPPRLV